MKRFFLLIFIIACFFSTVFAQLGSGSKGYYRIKNKQTGKYASIVDNEFSAAHIVDGIGGSKLLGNSNVTFEGQSMPAYDAAFIKAGRLIAKDIKLYDAGVSNYDTGSVILISDYDAKTKEYDLSAQDVKLSEITKQGTELSSGQATIPATYVIIDGNNSTNTYTASMHLTASGRYLFFSRTMDLGTKFFVDNNGVFSIDDSGTANNHGEWEIIPVNQANIETNYLAIKTIAANEQYGKYYTTFRAAFPFMVPKIDSQTLKIYTIPTQPTSGAILEEIWREIPKGDKVPAGLPVIVESDNLSDAFNKIIPITASVESRTTGLYNNYGVNDNEVDVGYKNHSTYKPTNLNEGTLDKVGYFKVKKFSDTDTYKNGGKNDGKLYKFGINSEGRVGFWDEVAANEIINGNEAYSTVPCALFAAPIETELKTLPDDTENGYRITDPLIVAYPDYERGVIYAKDDNGAEEQVAATGETDFMAVHMPADNSIISYGDHSNWVAVKVANWPTGVQKDDKIDVMGKVVDKVNRTIQGRAVKLNDGQTYKPNAYSVANFFGQHQQAASGEKFFFATPQPNEIVQMVWAMWDGQAGCFKIPPHSGLVNDGEFAGAIYANFSYYDGAMPTLVDGHQYRFLGLVRKETATSSTLLQAVPSNEYVVYPLSGWVDMDSDPIYTGVSQVGDAASVVGVKYYNLMGVESDVPFSGVNIVVSTMSDGSRRSAKVVR